MKKILGLFLIICFPFAILLAENSSYVYPDKTFTAQANVKDTQLFDLAQNVGFEEFWANEAKQLDWFQTWNRILEWKPPFAKWFINGKLNASYVCLDSIVNRGEGDKVALFWEGENRETRSLTYSEMLDQVCRCANVLKDLGVRKGDRVAIYMPIMPETIVAMLACARIGAPHLVIFGGIGPGGVRDRLNDSQAKVLITADGGFRRGKLLPFKEIADVAIQDASSVKKMLVVKRTGQSVTFDSSRDVWYEDVIKTASSNCNPESMDAEDMLFLLYTSGTTGKPKGIVHTTGGFLVGVHSTFKWVFDIKKEDVYWCTADMGWITGNSYVVYGPFSNGATQLIYEGAPDYPNQDRIWEMVEKYKVNIFYTAPTLIRTFIKWGDEWIKKHDISSLRLLGSIGEPINPDVWKWYRETVGSGTTPIVDTWFQTETGAFVISPLPGVTGLKPGSVTQALPGYAVEVLDEEGNKAERGILAIMQPFPSMLRGIYGDNERYKKTYWCKWGGKYYFAGDGATKDKDGCLWVYGRIDDVMKVSGHRIGSAELESATVEHPAIAEAAVIGIADKVKGEEIIVFATLKNGYSGSLQIKNDICDLIAKNIGSFARPKEIVFVSELPKNRSGKILRRIIRNLIMGEEIGDTTTLDNKGSIDDLKEKCHEVRKNLQL